MTALARDVRGAVMLETLIAFLPILVFFIGICSAADGYAHYLIVQRAASAAVRAAVVVLPDDPSHGYGAPEHSYSGQRKRAIERAARTILHNSPLFKNSKSSVRLVGFRPTARGKKPPVDPVNVEVTAEYKCIVPLLTLFCGRGRRVDLTASASLPYQGANYDF